MFHISNCKPEEQSWLNELVQSIQGSSTKDDFQQSMLLLDEKLCESYNNAPGAQSLLLSEIYGENDTRTVALGIPEQNSLTDSMLRSALGCEEKLAKSYLELQEQYSPQSQRDLRKKSQIAKKKFSQANNYSDFSANSKAFMQVQKMLQPRPVIDNEHQAYLKTQLNFLQQPLSGVSSIKQSIDKHSDTIALKISELGGMEDTISKMEDSLARHQIKSFKSKQILASDNRNGLLWPAFGKKRSFELSQSYWVERSKDIRAGICKKLQNLE